MYFPNIKDKIDFMQMKYQIINEIENHFQSKGYQYLDPHPIEDYHAIFQDKECNDIASIVKVPVADGTIKILSRDITSSLFSDVKNRWEKDLQLKVFYTGKVFRNDQKGIVTRGKIGVEYLGDDSLAADLEMLEMSIAMMERYSDDYLIEISSNDFMIYLLSKFIFSDQEYQELKHILLSKDRCSLKIFLEKYPDTEYKTILNQIFRYVGNYADLQKILSSSPLDERMKIMLSRLDQLYRSLQKNNCHQRILFDLSLVPEFSYYTGFTFRGYIENYNGEILKGGRYQILSENLMEKIPGVGFSIEIDELMNYLGGKV